jgi:hypothetical protein
MKTQDDFTKNQDRSDDSMLPPFPESAYRDSGSNPGHVENKQAPGDHEYQCPLKCQGEKTYDHPGKCPGSKMDLVPVDGGHIFY